MSYTQKKLTFKKAKKSQARLRMALIGPSGAGKTYSALAIASNLKPNAKVAVIDSERSSSVKYADAFDFDVLDLETHAIQLYMDAIKAAETAGYDVIVIDSLSHAWMGKDGALEQVDKATQASRAGNSYTAWRNVTPLQVRLMDMINASPCHIIATVRAKMEYVQEKDERGKTAIRKKGMGAIQRDGLEYEFDVVGELDQESNTMVITKTRCSTINGLAVEKPGAAFAEMLVNWLSDGAPEEVVTPADTTQAETIGAPKSGAVAKPTASSPPKASRDSVSPAVAGPAVQASASSGFSPGALVRIANCKNRQELLDTMTVLKGQVAELTGVAEADLRSIPEWKDMVLPAAVKRHGELS